MEAASPAKLAPNARKFALLIGINEYKPGNGWPTIHGEDDLEILAGALERQGFEPSRIAYLRGRKATKRAIVSAIERHLLLQSRSGDVLLLHFSGHGQRLPDGVDGDELDGYDEALVPWDAPRLGGKDSAGRAYAGQLHLRDDELRALLLRLRLRVGPRGNVVVLLDSYFSGSATRGEAPVRGAAPAMAPRPTAHPAENSGVGEATGLDMAGVLEGDGSLAPLVVFSAAASDQPAFEVKARDGSPVGALSLAMAATLTLPGLGSTYRHLFDEVRWHMVARAAGEPRAEGALDTALFSGRAVRQNATLQIASVSADRRSLAVRPGSLIGLQRGAEVEVQCPRAGGPDSEGLLVPGEVTSASPVEAQVTLREPLASDRPLACRVEVRRYSFGDLGLQVRLDLPVAQRQEIAGLARNGFGIEWVETAGDLVVTQRGAESGPNQPGSQRVALWEVREVASGKLLATIGKTADMAALDLRDYLRSVARSRYLRTVQLSHGTSRARLELRVARSTDPADLENPLPPSCQPLSSRRSGHGEPPPSGLLELPVGTCFRFFAKGGDRSMYLTLLDLRPDGGIRLLWPLAGELPEQIQAGVRKPLGSYFRATKPLGLDQFLLISSAQPLDFSLIEWPKADTFRSDGDPPSTLGIFAPLMAGIASPTRSKRVVVETDQVATSAQWVRVSAAESGDLAAAPLPDALPAVGTLEMVRGDLRQEQH